jgi:hypothetical protein
MELVGVGSGGGAGFFSGALFFLAQLAAQAMTPTKAAVSESDTEIFLFFMLAARLIPNRAQAHESRGHGEYQANSSEPKR